MVAATLLWGGTFVIIRDSLGGLDPQALVLARFLVAGLVFTVLARFGRGGVPRRVLGWGALSGVMVGACYLLQAIGLTEISAGSSAFLTCAGSLCTGLLAWPLLRQRPGALLLFGLVVALAGAALMSLDAGLRLGRGELITFAGAVAYALGIVMVAKLGSGFEPFALAAIQSWVTVLMLLPATPRVLEQFATLPAVGWTRFAYLALAGSVIAPLLQLRAQRVLPPGRIGLLLAIEPVFALVFALAFGGERFVIRWWAGAALILCAVVLVEWPSLRAPGPTPATPRSAE